MLLAVLDASAGEWGDARALKQGGDGFCPGHLTRVGCSCCWPRPRGTGKDSVLVAGAGIPPRSFLRKD